MTNTRDNLNAPGMTTQTRRTFHLELHTFIEHSFELQNCVAAVFLAVTRLTYSFI